MSTIIWALVLTVCTAEGQCFNQTVQWFDNENKCEKTRQVYEEIPKDGSWASVLMSWRCAEWFMNLEDPTMQQSAFVSVIMGVMTGIFGIWMGQESRGKKE